MAQAKIGIDLGSSNTKIYSVGNGVALMESTVVAVATNGYKNEIKAVGDDAKKLIGKTAENTKIVFPIFEGEVVNEKLATEMLSRFLKKIKFKQGMNIPLTLISVPCGAEVTLIKKFNKVATSAGLSNVYFVEAPILSAIGMGIPLTESSPCFIVDIGGGITNIAALSLDGIIAGISVSKGGRNIDTALIDYIADNYGLQIGLLTAERIKVQIGSLLDGDTLSTVINGRDLTTGRPRSIVLKAEDIVEPIREFFDKIFELATKVLSKLPPEVSAEIRHSGMYITGGSAGIVGLDTYCKQKFNMNINIASDPNVSTVLGTGTVLGNTELLKKIKITDI